MLLDAALLLVARDALIATIVVSVVATLAASRVGCTTLFACACLGDHAFLCRRVAVALLFGLASLFHRPAQLCLLALLRLSCLAIPFGETAARFLALAALFGDLLATFARAFGRVVVLPGLALGLFAALLLDAFGHPLALARLVDDQGFTALLLLLAASFVPVFVALRLVIA